jgi:HPt (histidine-containing phosphotransfer) domain-containing protein
LDCTRILEEVGGNIELLKRMAAVYFEHTPVLLRTIRAAVDSGHMPQPERAAHTLKRSLAQLVAHPAMQRAASLEHAACSGNIAQARTLEMALVRDVNGVDAALRQFIQEL